MEIKQRAPEQPMGQRRIKKYLEKQKWKHSTAKLRECSKGSAERSCTAITPMLRKNKDFK